MNKAEMQEALGAGETMFEVGGRMLRVDGGAFTHAWKIEVLEDGVEYERRSSRFAAVQTKRDGVRVRKIDAQDGEVGEEMLIARRCITRTWKERQAEVERTKRAAEQRAERGERLGELARRLGGSLATTRFGGHVTLTEKEAQALVERLESLETDAEYREDGGYEEATA
jgi:hypothetical protein